MASATSNQALAIVESKDKNRRNQDSSFGQNTHRGNFRGRSGFNRYRQNQRGRGYFRGSNDFRGSFQNRGFSNRGFSNRVFPNRGFSNRGFSRSTKNRGGFYCYICNQEGHRMSNCPSAQAFQNFRSSQNQNQNQTASNPNQFVGGVATRNSVQNSDSDIYMGHTLMVDSADKKTFNNTDWVLDSGCSWSLTNSMSFFTEFKHFSSPRVFTAANGSKIKATGFGTVVIQTSFGQIIESETFFSDEVDMNLFSAYSIRKAGYKINNDSDLTFEIFDKNGELMAIATPNDRFYVIKCLIKPVFSVISPDPLYLWHVRLGHANYKSVSQVTGIPFNSKRKPPICYPCLAGKQTKKRSKDPQIRAKAKLDLIHTDLGGPYIRSPSGYRYFMVFVDDFSRYIWIWFLKTKDKVATSNAIKEFKEYTKNQFKRKIKRIRTDNGTREYINSE